MRYIAKKLKKDEYEITHLWEQKTLSGETVETIKGKNIINKVKLEKAIIDFKEETKMIVEQRETEQQDMEKMLEAMNNSGK